MEAHTPSKRAIIKPEFSSLVHTLKEDVIMSTLYYSKNGKGGGAINVEKMQSSPKPTHPGTSFPIATPGRSEDSPWSQAPLNDGALPPRHLIRQFDSERALRDAESAGLLPHKAPPYRGGTPSPEMVALATVYVTAMFANTETPPGNEDRIAKISEVASFYSEPHRQARFRALVDAMVS